MLIQKGSTGALVSRWQNFLISHGYNIAVDAGFGDATDTATRDFQSKHGLTVDGKVGPETWIFTVEPITTKPVVTQPAEHLAVFPGSHIDQINSAMLAHVAPKLQSRVKDFIAAAAADGTVLQIVQGLRTFAEQNALYAQGRSRAGAIVTHAIGGQSLHNFGCAVDISPVINGQVSWNEKLYAPYAGWASKAGLEWGGSWKKFRDLPHIQDVGGMKLAEIQSLYRQGGLAAVWAKIT